LVHDSGWQQHCSLHFVGGSSCRELSTSQGADEPTGVELGKCAPGRQQEAADKLGQCGITDLQGKGMAACRQQMAAAAHAKAQQETTAATAAALLWYQQPLFVAAAVVIATCAWFVICWVQQDPAGTAPAKSTPCQQSYSFISRPLKEHRVRLHAAALQHSEVIWWQLSVSAPVEQHMHLAYLSLAVPTVCTLSLSVCVPSCCRGGV
jgi:hypothetical protein